MSTPDFTARLKSLSDGVKDVTQLISKLSKISPSESGQPDEGKARVELGSEIHQSLKELEEDFELLKQEAEDAISSGGTVSSTRRRDSEKDRDRIALVTQVGRLTENLKSYGPNLESGTLN